MPHIEDCILKAAGTKFITGDSFRIRHEYMENGNVCTSAEKDPAMVVTRVSKGWLFVCHRCHKQGMVPDNRITPDKTRKRIEAIQHIKVREKVYEVHTPSDIIFMGAEGEHEMQGKPIGVPWKAYHHLWKYGISGKTIPKYQIGWSDMWERLIIPLFEYANFGGELTYKLVGWVGRNVDYKKGDKYPKWLTRSMKGQRRFFMAPGEKDQGTVVLVEDAVSAIKVASSTGFTAIALLTTSVSNDLMRWLRDKRIFLWLDSDMLAHSVKTVTRMRSLGLDAKHIHTTKDPKEYNSLFITDTLRQKEANHET